MTDRKEILKKVSSEIENSFNIEKVSINGIPPWKAVLFLLKKINSGCYYGTVSIKINGTSVFDPVESEVKHRLDLEFNE